MAGTHLAVLLTRPRVPSLLADTPVLSVNSMTAGRPEDIPLAASRAWEALTVEADSTGAGLEDAGNTSAYRARFSDMEFKYA